MTIKDFIESELVAVGNMDLATFEPMSCFMFHPLWSKEWVEKIEEVMEKAEEKEIPIKELARSITGPSHIRAQFLFLLLDLKCARIEKKRRMKIANFFLQLLLTKATDDPCGFRSNKMHTSSEIRKLIQKIKFDQGSEEVAKLLGRLYAAAYHFTNGLYTDFYTDYGVEIFGEYKIEGLGEGYTLVIKRFFDLKPELLWPGIKSPCKELIIYSLYKDVKFTCDAISVHCFYEGDPIKSLVQWAVEIDGKLVDSIDEIKKLKDKFEICSVEQWKKLTGLEFEELKRKGLEMRGYIFREFFEKVGLNWRPNQKILGAVKDKPWVEESYWGMPESGKKEYWKRILDPEDDFYPLKS